MSCMRTGMNHVCSHRSASPNYSCFACLLSRAVVRCLVEILVKCWKVPRVKASCVSLLLCYYHSVYLVCICRFPPHHGQYLFICCGSSPGPPNRHQTKKTPKLLRRRGLMNLQHVHHEHYCRMRHLTKDRKNVVFLGLRCNTDTTYPTAYRHMPKPRRKNDETARAVMRRTRTLYYGGVSRHRLHCGDGLIPTLCSSLLFLSACMRHSAGGIACKRWQSSSSVQTQSFHRALPTF